MSSAYVAQSDTQKLRLPIPQRLYLPSRSNIHTNLPKTGWKEADNAVLYRFDQLVQAAPAEMKLAASPQG